MFMMNLTTPPCWCGHWWTSSLQRAYQLKGVSSFKLVLGDMAIAFEDIIIVPLDPSPSICSSTLNNLHLTLRHCYMSWHDDPLMEHPSFMNSHVHHLLPCSFINRKYTNLVCGLVLTSVNQRHRCSHNLLPYLREIYLDGTLWQVATKNDNGSGLTRGSPSSPDALNG